MAVRDRLVVSHVLVAVIAAVAPLTMLMAGLPDDIVGIALRARVIWIGVLAALAGGGVGVLVAHTLGAPVRRMADAATHLARGEPIAAPLPDDAGDIGALGRAIATMSSQLRSRMGDLTAERDRLSSLLEAMVDGVVVVGRAGRVVLANPAAQRLLGATGTLLGRTVAEIVRHPKGRSALDDALREGRPCDVELEAVAASSQAVLLSVRPLSDRGGGGVCAVIHDVTRLRRLERVRRDFVTNVSHELRTPVASIQSYSETLLDGALGDPATARKFVEVIHRNAARIGRLVRDLLQLSQLEARRPEQVIREAMSVREIAEGVRDTVAERAAQSGQTIELEIPAELQVLGDPDGVEQLLLNLVDNAIKYGKQGGKVTVSAQADGERVIVGIDDDGPGIESRHLPRIFERFYRIDTGRSSESGGTGLGLAIVKHLAESMGGTVEVESTLGRGSRFTIRLPLA